MLERIHVQVTNNFSMIGGFELAHEIIVFADDSVFFQVAIETLDSLRHVVAPRAQQTQQQTVPQDKEKRNYTAHWTRSLFVKWFTWEKDIVLWTCDKTCDRNRANGSFLIKYFQLSVNHIRVDVQRGEGGSQQNCQGQRRSEHFIVPQQCPDHQAVL